MAPRRLIIAMLILLAFSTALAIAVPGPPTPSTSRQDGAGKGTPGKREVSPAARKEVPSRNGTSGDEGDARDGEVVRASVRNGGPVETVAVRNGDRLILEVRSPGPVEVEVEGAGLVDTAGPYDPAQFDLLVRSSPSRLLVRVPGSESEEIAVIEVR